MEGLGEVELRAYNPKRPDSRQPQPRSPRRESAPGRGTPGAASTPGSSIPAYMSLQQGELQEIEQVEGRILHGSKPSGF